MEGKNTHDYSILILIINHDIVSVYGRYSLSLLVDHYSVKMLRGRGTTLFVILKHVSGKMSPSMME